MAITTQVMNGHSPVSDWLARIRVDHHGCSTGVHHLDGSGSRRKGGHLLANRRTASNLKSQLRMDVCTRLCNNVCTATQTLQKFQSPERDNLLCYAYSGSHSRIPSASRNWHQNGRQRSTAGSQGYCQEFVCSSNLVVHAACHLTSSSSSSSSSSRRRRSLRSACSTSWRARWRDWERVGSSKASNDRAVTAQVATNAAATSPSTPPQVPADAEPAAGGELAASEKPEAYVILSSGSFMRDVPLKKLAVWSAVALAVYELRDFVGIFMGTFVLSVVGNSLVAWFQQMLPTFKHRRRPIVGSMYLLTVAAVVLLGFLYLPGFTQEAAEIVYKVQRNEDPYRIISDRLRVVLGEKVTDQLERFLLMAVSRADTVVLDMTVTGSREQRSQALQAVLKKYSGQLMSYFATAVTASSRFALQSIVSLILSFMIVWDFAAIQKGLQSLSNSRLSAFYEEIAPVVATFGRIFGKALQAQSAIAVVNTFLTALGMLVLKIQGVGPLSVITFFCSFVPVAGVILSTVPISLVAVTEGGFMKVGLVILLVVLIHAVEAYILNPAIYSAHLKLHPILALGVIIFAEHALGVWGLLVAVPMAVFFIEYLIMRKPITIEEPPSAA